MGKMTSQQATFIQHAPLACERDEDVTFDEGKPKWRGRGELDLKMDTDLLDTWVVRLRLIVLVRLRRLGWPAYSLWRTGGRS